MKKKGGEVFNLYFVDDYMQDFIRQEDVTSPILWN